MIRKITIVAIVLLLMIGSSYISYNLGMNDDTAQVKSHTVTKEVLVTPVDQAEILYNVNALRIATNLRALRENVQLDKSAMAKCTDMLSQHYFAHVNPQGQQPWVFFQAEKYDYSRAGENLGMSQNSQFDVVTAWKNSPEHYENIENAKFTDTGVAVCHDATNYYFVQHFGTPA